MIHEPGIYEGMSEEEYFADDSFSKSQVTACLKSGKHLVSYKQNGISGKALETGKLVDTLLLTPEEYTTRFIMAPETYENTKGEIKPWDYRSPVCQEWKARASSSGRVVITYEDKHNADRICESVKSYKTACELLDGVSQVSMFWVDAETGVPCKGRLDILRPGTAITDLKTSSRDVDLKSFQKDMYNFKYHVQAFAYTEGYEILTGEKVGFDFVAVETAEPFGVGCYSIREDSLLLGEMEWRKALRRYAEYLEKGFDGYPDVLQLIDVPAWALKPIFDGDPDDLIL